MSWIAISKKERCPYIIHGFDHGEVTYLISASPPPTSVKWGCCFMGGGGVQNTWLRNHSWRTWGTTWHDRDRTGSVPCRANGSRRTFLEAAHKWWGRAGQAAGSKGNMRPKFTWPACFPMPQVLLSKIPLQFKVSWESPSEMATGKQL